MQTGQVVDKERLELSRLLHHTVLNRTRLPVPPLVLAKIIAQQQVLSILSASVWLVKLDG